MAKQHTASSQTLKFIAGVAIVGLGAACELTHLSCDVAGKLLGLLPLLVRAIWPALQALAFEHLGLLEWLFRLISCWPLIRTIGMAL